MINLARSKHALFEFITFRIAEQYYCIDITKVREIRCWSPTTPVPCSAPYFMGVMNLRGTAIPVMDLAVRMGFGKTTPGSRHAIVVVEVGEQSLGLLVEAVSEILTIESSRLQPAPAVGSTRADNLIEGIISIDERIVTVLALERFSAEEDDSLHVHLRGPSISDANGALQVS